MKHHQLLFASILVFGPYQLLYPSIEKDPFTDLRPTQVPEVFYPGSVSTGIDKFNTSFTPDLKEIYYTVTSQKWGVTGIVFQRWQEDGGFSKPEFVPFVDTDIPVADVQISPDGKELYFATFKDWDGKVEGFHFDIWVSSLSNDGKWQQPHPLNLLVNSRGNEFYPVKTHSGNLYFNSDVDGNSDLYVSRWEDGNYLAAERLPETINSELQEADAFVAADESFIVFVRVDAPDGLGNSDLYFSRNLGGGRWSEAQHLGAINSDGIDGSPYVTPDGRFLIFTSDRKDRDLKGELFENFKKFQTVMEGYQNGSLNFFLVDFEAVVEALP